MKAYVLMWGHRVCSSGIAHTFVPENPDIWFDLSQLEHRYKSYDITTTFKEGGWWILEWDV